MTDSKTVPVIDIEGIWTEDETVMKELGRQIDLACKEIGFFYITNHGIPKTLTDKMEELSKEFFALPEEVKQEIRLENAGRAWRGYFPVGIEYTSGRVDQKEGIYFGTEIEASDPRVQARTPMHGPNQWPKHPSELASVVLEYLDRVSKLAHLLLKTIALGLGLPYEYFSERFTSSPTVLFRIFNYPEHTFKEEDDEWGVRQHTDMGFLTILLQDFSGGLQVKNKAGNWIEAPPLENSFVVNIGDMLEFWTHGLYTATLHRVRNQASGPRLSFPLFFDPNWDCSLEPIDLKDLNEESSQYSTLDSRWDKLDLNAIRGLTYGEFVWSKISKVFPHLASMDPIYEVAK